LIADNYIVALTAIDQIVALSALKHNVRMTTFFDKNTKSNIIILPVLRALFGIYKFTLLLRLNQDVF
jgi:hypothetical protein